jgi:hypothetical protein
VLFRALDGPLHHDRIAAVEAAGDVGQGDVRHQRVVGAEVVDPERLPHVAIQLNGCH